MKIGLCSEIGDAQAQNRELVELRQDALLEGQQRGQRVQLRVEALAMPLARVRLAVRVLAADGSDASFGDRIRR